MQHIRTIGDMAITFDGQWYYVRHASTDKLICKTIHKHVADKVASANSDYHGDPRNRD